MRLHAREEAAARGVAASMWSGARAALEGGQGRSGGWAQEGWRRRSEREAAREKSREAGTRGVAAATGRSMKEAAAEG